MPKQNRSTFPPWSDDTEEALIARSKLLERSRETPPPARRSWRMRILTVATGFAVVAFFLFWFLDVSLQ